MQYYEGAESQTVREHILTPMEAEPVNKGAVQARLCAYSKLIPAKYNPTKE